TRRQRPHAGGFGRPPTRPGSTAVTAHPVSGSGGGGDTLRDDKAPQAYRTCPPRGMAAPSGVVANRWRRRYRDSPVPNATLPDVELWNPGAGSSVRAQCSRGSLQAGNAAVKFG